MPNAVVAQPLIGGEERQVLGALAAEAKIKAEFWA